MEIDTHYYFTADTPGYWKGFWTRNGGLGSPGADPDAKSKTLNEYHRMLWTRRLPNGEWFELASKQSSNNYYLTNGDDWYSSDSITATFRYYRNRRLVDRLAAEIVDYRTYMMNLLQRLYTIGGMMIWPCKPSAESINVQRGFNATISDRFDRTLECIRRFYNGETSPLSRVMEANRGFFEKFVDFNGFVDFFFFQDCVTPDYQRVIMWLGDSEFTTPALPKTLEQYRRWIRSQVAFVEKRNKRIEEFLEQQKRPGRTQELLSSVAQNHAEEAIEILRSGDFDKGVLQDIGFCLLEIGDFELTFVHDWPKYDVPIPLYMLSCCHKIILDRFNETDPIRVSKENCAKLLDFWEKEYDFPVRKEVDFSPYRTLCRHWDVDEFEDTLNCTPEQIVAMGYNLDEAMLVHAVVSYDKPLLDELLAKGTNPNVNIADARPRRRMTSQDLMLWICVNQDMIFPILFTDLHGFSNPTMLWSR